MMNNHKLINKMKVLPSDTGSPIPEYMRTQQKTENNIQQDIPKLSQNGGITPNFKKC